MCANYIDAASFRAHDPRVLLVQHDRCAYLHQLKSKHRLKFPFIIVFQKLQADGFWERDNVVDR